MSLPVLSHHPDEKQLERFMRLDLSRPEVVPLVRHLMTGCRRCREVTRRFWELGESATPIPRGVPKPERGNQQRSEGI